MRVGVDDSLFAGPMIAPTWERQYVPTGAVAPVSALMVDQARTTPARSPGSPTGARHADPALAAGTQFATMLAAEGVPVSPGVTRTSAPPDAARLAAVDSLPVADMVERMLTTSDNDVAEALARQVALRSGAPATFDGGGAATVAALQALGVPTQGVSLSDGSGLARSDAVPAQTLASVLVVAASPEHPELRAVLTGLPVAGFNGTLADRFADGGADTAGRRPRQDRHPHRGEHPRGRGRRRRRVAAGVRGAGRRGAPQRHAGRPPGPRRGRDSAGRLRLPLTREAPRVALTYGGPMTGLGGLGGPSNGQHDMVDWELAVATGARLVPAGPQVTREQAREAVAQLRAFALRAQDHVRDYTGLVADGDGSAVAVIDRPGWIRANAAGFRAVITPLEHRLQERRGNGGGPLDTIGPKVTGVQTGSLLAFLATKVLGQYELFSAYDDPAPGRLLLVAPNIVAAEREMGVDPSDFRLWVCLHEETHRVQFSAVPWLRQHVLGEIRTYLDATEVDPAALARRLRDGVGAVVEALRGESSSDAGALLEAVQTPAQREILDRLTAVMSLLEGHADVVMDGVGPDVVPSVATIRERFQRRRQGRGWADQMVRRLLGLDAKMRQYRDGAAFVRHVVAEVGRDGFNRVWSSPEALPTRAELLAPAGWIARVVR